MASSGSRYGSQACMRASERGNPRRLLNRLPEPKGGASALFFQAFLWCSGAPVAVGTCSLPPEYMSPGRAPCFEVQGTVSLCRGRELEQDVTRKKPTPVNPQTQGHNSKNWPVSGRLLPRVRRANTSKPAKGQREADACHS